MTLLSIADLRVHFRFEGKLVRANEDVNLHVGEGEALGIIGETGSGKSILGKAIIRLLSPSAEVSGSIHYQGRELLWLSEREMSRLRGREIAIILQNPSTALDPTMSVGDQVAEVYRYQEGMAKKISVEKASEMLVKVGIDPSRMNEYPHQFSGGMQQRISLAIALALKPRLLIADEPTKGLDKESKEQMIDLMTELRGEKEGMILITHDVSLAERICDRVAVMYAGEIIEEGPVGVVLPRPLHPYTRHLLNALPSRGFTYVGGESPRLSALPSGCRFYPRCEHATEVCRESHPTMMRVNGERVRCFLYEGGEGT